jgi:hypothetical protein
VSYQTQIWLFILAITVIALGLDIYWATASKDQESISWEIWSQSERRPIIAFLFGVLMGHFFWQMV